MDYSMKQTYSSEHVKELVLKELRRKGDWCTQKIIQLENENKEQRSKGVPFKDRRQFTRHIEIVAEMGKKIKAKELMYSKMPASEVEFSVLNNAVHVDNWDLEKKIKYALI